MRLDTVNVYYCYYFITHNIDTIIIIIFIILQDNMGWVELQSNINGDVHAEIFNTLNYVYVILYII